MMNNMENSWVVRAFIFMDSLKFKGKYLDKVFLTISIQAKEILVTETVITDEMDTL